MADLEKKDMEQLTDTNTVEQKATRSASRDNAIITINNSAIPERIDAEREIAWHELTNSMIRKSILTGTLVSMEPRRISENESINVAIVEYQGYHVIIPTSEMNIILNGRVETGKAKQAKVTSNMVGCDIDFVVLKMNDAERTVVASRKLAMERKIQDFYLDKTSATGKPVINEGAIVEARVVSLTDEVLRLEVFGIECFVRIIDLEPAWIADAREKYNVGDNVYVRMKSINFEGENPEIKVEGENMEQTSSYKCVKEGKYSGIVTSVRNGMYFIRLRVGVNAVAHTYKGGYPLPKKKDEVSFICTRFDEEKNGAVGIIARVIKPYR